MTTTLETPLEQNISPLDFDPQHIINTVNRHQSYFSQHSTLDIAFRLQQLNKLREALQAFEPAILEALHQDLGRCEYDSWTCEFSLLYTEIKLMMRFLKKWTNKKRVPDTLATFPSRSYLYHRPHGVCLILSPWNYPVVLSLQPLIGAIAAGNCVCLKLSEYACNTSKVIKQLLTSIFMPEYISVHNGSVRQSQFLLDQPFDFIFFTGSTTVGKQVYQKAAAHLIPCVLELGGKSPCIIDKSTDLETAVKRVLWGKTVNAGQTCVAPDTLIVHDEIYSLFIESFEQHKTAIFGTDPLAHPKVGKLISQEHFTRVLALAKEHECIGELIYDEQQLKIMTTLIKINNLQCRIMKEEIFGPLLPICRFSKLEDIRRIIQLNPDPLALYIFAEDKTLIEQLIATVPAGGIGINDVILHLAQHHLPFGGIRSSGVGAYHGKTSFEVFGQYRSVYQKGRFDFPLRYSHNTKLLRFIKRVIT